MKTLRAISRILVGIVFAFSGFVKAVDPMGSTFKFKDYFAAFAMEWLAPTALFLAIILSALEFVLGIALVFKARLKTAAWIALLFMSFFTALTLVLAISNPVSDCGCFGDALILTNWETFGKNIILLAFTLVIFCGRKRTTIKSSVKEQLLLLGFSLFVILGISNYSYNHLPILDFRPYHGGANIKEGMAIPDGAPADQYNTIFHYQKEGKVKEFTQENYPWQDSTWEFVDAQQIKIKEGYHPPIHDFSISNDVEGDITDLVLNDEGFTFVLVARNLEETNTKNQNQINELATFSADNGHLFIGLTASLPEEITSFRDAHQIPYEFYNTDEIQLKTMIRSNPGLLLIHKGTILRKWHFNDLPKVTDLNNELNAYSITGYEKTTNKLRIISITSIFLLLLCFYQMVKFRGLVKKNRLRL